MAQVIGSETYQWTAEDLFRRFGPISLGRIVFDPVPGTATVEDVIEFDDHKVQLCELYDGMLVRKTDLPESGAARWTAEDLYHRFGPIPLWRIVADPAPGTATVEDVVKFDDHKDELCELINGMLVRKIVGAYESLLAVKLITFLNSYVLANGLGIVLGPDGMMELLPDLVRIPDVSFISHERLKNSGFPDEAAPHVAPELAIEVISRGNTRQEMDQKLREYFEAGTNAVWYVYPKTRKVVAYSSPEAFTELSESDTLDAGEVLPGFTLDLKSLFTTPGDPTDQPK